MAMTQTSISSTLSPETKTSTGVEEPSAIRDASTSSVVVAPAVAKKESRGSGSKVPSPKRRKTWHERADLSRLASEKWDQTDEEQREAEDKLQAQHKEEKEKMRAQHKKEKDKMRSQHEEEMKKVGTEWHVALDAQFDQVLFELKALVAELEKAASVLPSITWQKEDNYVSSIADYLERHEEHENILGQIGVLVTELHRFLEDRAEHQAERYEQVARVLQSKYLFGFRP